MSLLVLDVFEKAIDTFERTCIASNEKIVKTLPQVLQDAIKAGVIQNFEFTYELAWKFMKRWLEKNYGGSMIDGVTRRELFRLAQEHHLIEDCDTWMFYHRARNLTSHTYDQAVAEEVYQDALTFLVHVKHVYMQLKSKND